MFFCAIQLRFYNSRSDGMMDKLPERNQSSPNESDSILMSEESDKVSQILSQVSQLSELEKYMLYLQLPTEEAIDDNGEETNKIPSNSVAKRTDTALRWIRQNYVESHDTDSYVPKEEVYEQYREQCEADDNKLLSIADFGKAMKLVFPKITHRRLGQRGKSKYCYEGLRKRGDNSTPSYTSSIQNTAEKPCPDGNLYALSCQLVCEWASQLLSRQLTDIKSLSEYLISIGFSCGKTAAKFSLLSGSTSPPKQMDKDRKAVRHQDGQLLIQRKLQHKEIIRKHKQKLQEQQKLQRELAKACSPVSSVQPFTVDLRTADVVGGKRILPRPQSVQPCVPYWNAGHGQEAGNISISGSVLSLAEIQKNISQDNSKLLGLLLANSKSKGSLVPLKRCQSASVVEKHSMSCDIGEVFRQQLTTNQLFCDPNRGSDMTEQKTSNPLLHPTYTTISLPSPSIFTMAWPSQASSKTLDSLLSMGGLMLTQQHKRNGGNISPDGNSKRRCMTSLGVKEPDNFHPIGAGNDGELSRSRPYSCPVSWDGLTSQSHDKSPGSSGTHELTAKDVSSAGTRERKERSKKKQGYSDSFKEDKGLKINSSTESQENRFHFVQKPTVINRPINMMHNVSSCPDFQQISRKFEKQEPESRTGRLSGTILNSLLSSTSDLLWKKCEGSLEIPHTDSSPSLAANVISTVRSASELDSLQNNHQLRLMNVPSNSSENNVILSALSSRSAFVPVTSHKQLVSTILKEVNHELSEHSHSVPLSESCQTKLDHFGQNTSTSTQSNSKIESSHSFSSSVDGSQFNKHLQSGSCSSVIGSSSKADVYLSSSCSSTYSSATPLTATLNWPGGAANSGNESAFTSPITSLVSSTAQSHTSKKEHLSASSPNVHVSGATTSLKSGTPCQSQITAISPSPHTSHTNSSPATPSRRVCRNRFTPIRPKIGGAPSPQKLVTGSTTPSPQKKDIRNVSTILKEHRLKIAQDLLVNLANSYQGEVKLQMPAELLGLSPGKSKSADLLVTIGPPSNKNQQTVNNNSPQLWPLMNPSPHHQDMKVVVEPITQVTSNTSPAFSSTLLSPPPGSAQRQNTGQSLGLQVITCHTGGNNLELPLALYSPTLSVRHEEPALSKQVVILSPPRSASSTEVVLGKSIFVEDSQGNKYSIEEGSNRSVVNQNLRLDCQNKQSSKVSDMISESTRQSSGILNVSEINGHVIGPDANGQSYLIVPNSESNVAVSDGGSSLSLVARSTTMKPASVSQAGVSFSSQQITSCASGPRLIQTTTSSSSALLSELSQLASAGKKMGNQPLIQHNSFSSAFHKCSSKLHLKSPSVLDSSSKFDLHGNKMFENVYVNSELSVQKTQASTVGQGPEMSPNLTRKALETPSATKKHPVRKRKSGADDHGSNKKSNRCKEKEVDDDVFIINIDDEDLQHQNPKINISSTGPQSESADSKVPSWYCEKTDVDSAQDQETKPLGKPLLTDTEALLEMIPNLKSRSMTVKETVRALNSLRAKISSRDQALCKSVLDPLSQHKPPQQDSDSSNQVSAQTSSQPVNSKSSDVQLCKRTGGRYVSLNLESLESDALLDIEQALDRRLFGDLPEGFQGFSDHKTSIGIAAKTAKALASSNQSKQPLLSQQISEHGSVALTAIYPHHNATLDEKKQKVYTDVSQSGDTSKENIDKQNSFLFEVKEPTASNISNHSKSISENKSNFFALSQSGVRQGDSGLDRKNSQKDSHFQADFLDFLQYGSTNLCKDSNGSNSSTDKGKASDHPTLAQWLARTVTDKPDSDQRYSSPALPSYYDNLQPVQMASQANMSSENELPGDIVDFITESMSSRKHYPNSVMFHNSPSSLLADLIKKDKQDSKEIQNSTVWRSISVPNTPADMGYDRKQTATVSDLIVKQDVSSDYSRNIQCNLECLASNCGGNQLSGQQHTDLSQQKSIETSSQNSSSGTFLSPVGPAKLTRRLSIERSVSNDYTTSKTPNVESQSIKANDRPPSRLKTNAERLQSKTPVDRLISKILTDRSGRHVVRDEGMSEAYQQISREKESIRSLLSRNQQDKSRHGSDPTALTNLTCTNWLEAAKGDRSLNQTPLSDGGYSSVSQTPISEVGSVSPSPVMMATTGFFGDCERRDILSPATIFMPLRSDSVLSGLYHTRNCGPDSFNCKQSNSSQVSSRGSEEQEHTVLNVRTQTSKKGSDLSDALTGFEMDSPKNTPQSDSGKTYDQNLNASFLQLHCIPTPPSSPSSPHQRAQETVHSPLHFKEVFSESNWQNESMLTASSVSFGQEFLISSAGDVQNTMTGTSRQTVASSPSSSIHKIPPVTSPTPQISRCHQYNPHPSPPFTPSSQRCVMSPRCPTPCSHISPRCTTPNNDANLAPNRFVPIQTSGILGNSAVGYIQPIRPVVTIASAANQNLYTLPLLSTPFTNKKFDAFTSSFLKSESDFSGSSGVQLQLKTDQHTQVTGERNVPPAFVLSLSGAIGSVSGKGMKDGWGSQDITVATMSHQPQPFDSVKVVDQTQNYNIQFTTSNSDMLPTYEEAVSLLSGSSSDYKNQNLVQPENRERHQGKTVETNPNKSLDKPTSSVREAGQPSPGHNQVCRAKPIKINDTPSPQQKMASSTDLVTNPSDKLTEHSLPQQHSVVTGNQSLARQLQNSNSLRLLLGTNNSSSRKKSSLSTMLQAPAFTSVHQKSQTIQSHADIPAGTVNVKRSLGNSGVQTQLVARIEWKSSDNSDHWLGKSSAAAPAADSAQEGIQISELPTAYYTGTAPNKTAFSIPSFDQSPMYYSQQAQLINIRSDKRDAGSRQDELDETLDVLKNLDSHYFQQDDEDDML